MGNNDLGKTGCVAAGVGTTGITGHETTRTIGPENTGAVGLGTEGWG